MSNEDSNHLEIAKKAGRDLRKMPRPARDQIARTLRHFELGHPNMDVKQVTDRPPYLRLRTGDYRILFRPLSPGERQRLLLRLGSFRGPNPYVVARIVDRAELARAVATLNLCELED